jgi:aconitate hydratase
MLASAMICKNALAKGLRVKSYIKTSFSPGSGVVTSYIEKAGLTKYLDEMGYNLAGYGCMTCIGNSGDIP